MGLVSRTGETLAGLPVSTNAAPPPHQADAIGRYFITVFDQPADAMVEDILLNETAMVRVLGRGEWEAHLGPRGWQRFAGPVLFGAQRRALRVRVRGPMATAGFAIRPSGWPRLDARPAHLLANRLEAIAEPWGAALDRACADIDDHERTFAALMQAVDTRLHAVAGESSEPMRRFEEIARTDPGRSVSDIAEEFGLTLRRLDAHVQRHFGHTPKSVLRRSRFLDMAAVMRGLSIPDEETLVRLRFYDASHLNLEFRKFVDMTPAAFARTPTPLLTPGLEVRAQRKLADLAAQVPAPWRASA